MKSKLVNVKDKTSNKKNLNNNSKKLLTSKKNIIIMKILTVLGVLVFFVAIVYLMNYFFIEKSYIKINMSTDKKLVYLEINGEEELITTQKYVSDLEYSMRYDVDKFSVFKYKEQDIFKLKNSEKVLILVEKSNLPNTCSQTTLDNEYNNCYIKVDNYTEEYYVSINEHSYKITLKSLNITDSEIKERIIYMLNSFEIGIK